MLTLDKIKKNLRSSMPNATEDEISEAALKIFDDQNDTQSDEPKLVNNDESI